VLASILEGSIKEAVARDLADGVPSFELVRADLNEVKTLYDQDASQRLANVVATSHRAALRLIGILGFTFLLSSTAVWAIQRSRMLHAVQLGKLKMEFLASVSHELRTPLAVLNSAADNIADGLVEGTEELQKYGAILQNQSRRMGGLVDEILLFASTEDPKNRYTLQPLLVSQILESVVARTQELIHAQGFTLEEQVEPGLPLVMADLTGTSQCLQNLISNAVKYSGSNRWIAMGARTAVLENGAGQEVRIFVADRGIGIDRSELEYIFDPFWRSPRVNSAQIHGTGLGLSLTKRIAEAMGASVSVVSELSVGSTFTLHLRIAEGDGAQRSAVLSRPTPAPHP
jgi:signal transduction histidine kinase